MWKGKPEQNCVDVTAIVASDQHASINITNMSSYNSNRSKDTSSFDYFFQIYYR